MKAMIMAAGVGSRLDPITRALPKPMIPITDRPLMEYIVNLLNNHGVEDIIANLHYMPESIIDYFGHGEEHGVRLSYSLEKQLMGTAGGVKNNQQFLNEAFFVISGDALTDIDLSDFARFHREKKALATIALKKVSEVEGFGVVITDDNHRITAFQEKPKAEDALSDLVNTGIYIFEPEIFNYIPQGKFFDFGMDLFPFLVASKMPFFGYFMAGYWQDIGTPKNYQQAKSDVHKGKVKLYGSSGKLLKNRGVGS